MEKTIIAALLMLISLISYAQGLMWTAKAELNMSSMSNVEESKMHPGFYAGMGAGYVIDETWSVRPCFLSWLCPYVHSRHKHKLLPVFVWG